MSIKLFILGRPGSGKSTAYRHIEEYLDIQYKGWSITRYNDYDILYEMFLFEKHYLYNKQKQFLASKSEGFDVLDFTVLDTALVKLEKAVRARSSKKKDEIIVIEFARQDYKQALALFSPSFLKESYFLFLDTDVKTSVRRVKKRVTTPPTPDNHYVSEEIITGYYGKQIIPNLIKTKSKEVVDKDRIKIVPNRGDNLDSFNLVIEDFIDHLMDHNTPITQSHPVVQRRQFRLFAGKSFLGMIPLFFFAFNWKKVSYKALFAKLGSLHTNRHQMPQEKGRPSLPR